MGRKPGMKTAVIAGYTGLVGRHLLDLLLASDQYNKVIAVGRRALSIDNPKLEFQIVNFDKLSLSGQVDDVFCCLGTTMKKAGSKEKFRIVDFQFPLNLALEAKNKGAKSFILVTANGANKNSIFFYNRVKGEAEEAIEQLKFDKLEIVRPSLLLGDRKESRFLEDVGQAVARAVGVLFVGPLQNVKGISAKTVARAMIYLANDGIMGHRIHRSGELHKY
jgi:uncharacterized protein YbjT (DUF2867 family)